jgi:ATP-dependent Lon protease
MVRPDRIPLFPLDVVLMPGAELPLHIFEPRYKVMIARCLDEKLEFGMILAANQAVAGLGCTAEILRKIRDYPDGRMDILTTGRAVFRLTELLEEKEYYEGVVEYLEDGAYAPDAHQETQLVQLFETCHTLLFSSPWMDDAEAQEATLAYRMAALLPVALEERQALLEIRSEHQRREMVLRWMERFVPKLIAQQKTRERAGGNGHARN